MLLRALRDQKRRDVLIGRGFTEDKSMENRIMRWPQTIAKLSSATKQVILVAL